MTAYTEDKLSREQRNRRKIDFSQEPVKYDSRSESFRMSDGRNLPLREVDISLSDGEVQGWRVCGNVAELLPGTYLKMYDRDGKAYFAVVTERGILPYSHVLCEVSGEEGRSLVVECMTKLLELLCYSEEDGDAVLGIYQAFSYTQVEDYLRLLGFLPGKITVRKGGHENTYFWNGAGEIYGKGYSENEIAGINFTNYLKYGISRDTVWFIDGCRYHMDKFGHFHIPSGIMCIPDSSELIDGKGNPVEVRLDKNS